MGGCGCKHVLKVPRKYYLIASLDRRPPRRSVDGVETDLLLFAAAFGAGLVVTMVTTPVPERILKGVLGVLAIGTAILYVSQVTVNPL